MSKYKVGDKVIIVLIDDYHEAQHLHPLIGKTGKINRYDSSSLPYEIEFDPIDNDYLPIYEWFTEKEIKLEHIYLQQEEAKKLLGLNKEENK